MEQPNFEIKEPGFTSLEAPVAISQPVAPESREADPMQAIRERIKQISAAQNNAFTEHAGQIGLEMSPSANAEMLAKLRTASMQIIPPAFANPRVHETFTSRLAQAA